jgi:hypothetical protein
MTHQKMRNRFNAKTYEQKVSCLIREKYSQDAEFAILRQKDNKPEEFAEYNNYCEECKNKVKNGIFDNEIKEFQTKQYETLKKLLNKRK